MDAKALELCKGFVSSSYVQQATEALQQRNKLITQLLEHRRLPENGWDDQTIELFLQHLAAMDSNNFRENAGVGEREARIASDMVARRHFRLCHGIGRSGDIAAEQPKAAGSSLLVKLTNILALDLLRLAGLNGMKKCILFPMATGMTLSLVFLTLRPGRPTAKYILWPRIDQKSCFKAMCTAGFTPVIVDGKLQADAVMTNLERMEEEILARGPEAFLCVFSTTSCFAPRVPDAVDEIARLCAKYDIPHVINNAYGLQSSKICSLINEAVRAGRVDCVVQSTDKNFMTPIGGAITCGPDPQFIEKLGKMYPGRASNAPTVDLFITMMTWISVAISLATFSSPTHSPSFLGSMLFSRMVSGTRVVTGKDSKEVGGVTFEGFGAHHPAYPVPYLSAACAIGITEQEMDLFIARLSKTMESFKRKRVAANEILEEQRTASTN